MYRRNAAARHAALSGALHSYNFGVTLASYHKAGTSSIVGDGEPAGSNPGAREDSASVSGSQAGDVEMTGALDLGAEEMNAWGEEEEESLFSYDHSEGPPPYGQ
ncbi:hypothetical protein N7541_006428 [Penicillium brevicompactum]|uniref:Uncharacterized protein n=1 Tax=Penicillium brevicompactum TaxID=5074 RepID=A0A9W9R740_PENBR|nr:hypothetical protein N7541_006428 [Penicillium brevicompactum]